MVEIANKEGDRSTVADIANKLSLSKIYLEQIFSTLRKAGLLNSLKGKQGGYLAKKTSDISVYDILSSLEQTLFEPTDQSFSDSKPVYDKTFEEVIFTPLDKAVKQNLQSISLEELVNQVNDNIALENYMFYI